MNKITPQDIQRGVESVTTSPESTWYKTVETFDNGDELCFAIGMGEGFDESTVCAKLGVLAGNSAMSDYTWDFVMPWNLGEGDNDTWDTEVSNPNESDAEWFNKQAEEIIRGFEDGTIGTSLVGSSRKVGKKKPITSGNLSMKERAANREFEKQQKDWYSKPGVERARAHHEDKVEDKINMLIPTLCDQEMEVKLSDDKNTLDYNMRFNPERGLELGIKDFYNKFTGNSSEVTNGSTPNGEDNYHQMHTLFANIIEKNKYKGQPIELSQEGDEIWVEKPYLDVNRMSDDEIEDYIMFFHKLIANAAPKVYKALEHRLSLQSSRRPIKSMYVTEDISGNDLYTRLWSGGKDQFDSMIEDGADADDILNACEELLFREEGNPPTMTEVNDLIWFEPDTIREYIGLTSPIESGCHGKSKKGKGKKKAIKSALSYDITDNFDFEVIRFEPLQEEFAGLNFEVGEIIDLNNLDEIAEPISGYGTAEVDYEGGDACIKITFYGLLNDYIEDCQVWVRPYATNNAIDKIVNELNS